MFNHDFLPLPLMAHFQPPESLTDEGKRIYDILIAQIRVVTAFYSHPDAHLQSVEVISKWFDALKQVRQTAITTLSQLHGKSQNTWIVGNLIRREIFPIYAALSIAPSKIDESVPKEIARENLSEPDRKLICELKEKNFQPLLNQLAIEMANEYGDSCGLDSSPEHCYVTLDQMAALVNRQKKSLERVMNDEKSAMPLPDVEGGGGKAHEWIYDKIRPWLEEKYGRKLPKRPPSLNPSRS